jgi:glucose-6-phosphate 1-dehydrogenase
MKETANQVLVIFGASGDLTKRKLIPALYDLYIQKLLPPKFAVLGASRTVLSDDDFRKRVSEFLPAEENTEPFKEMLFYQQVSNERSEDFLPLKNRLVRDFQKFTDSRKLYFLSIHTSFAVQCNSSVSR